jgi:hypothetical protein
MFDLFEDTALVEQIFVTTKGHHAPEYSFNLFLARSTIAQANTITRSTCSFLRLTEPCPASTVQNECAIDSRKPLAPTLTCRKIPMRE